MDHISRTVESRPGLTQEEALASLQKHPQFKVGTIIESIKPRGNFWVAQLKEPKVAAEFPPVSDDEESESPEEEASESPADEKDEGENPFSGEESDGPPSPPKEKSEKPEKKEEAQISELVDLVHAIADKLGISPAGPDLGDAAPLGDVPPGPPPSPHGGPGGPGPGGPGGPPPHAPKKDLPQDAAPLTGFAKKIPSFVASTSDDISIKEAKADLEKEFPGYNVKRINRQGGKLHALLSVR